jgi:cytidylate kinase
VIAIDGPSGSGKGTISRGLATHLGWHLLDSGALYRLVALAAARLRVESEDLKRLVQVAETMNVAWGGQDGREGVFLEGADVTRELRSEKAGAAASKVAAIPLVRQALLPRQRAFAQPPGLVADGRDMGTVVFPQAALKVFLTASPEERATRRHKQLKEKGIDVSLPDLSWDIAQRDTRDANRLVAPLRSAPDARVIDSTRLSPEEVIARILTWLEAAGVERQE